MIMHERENKKRLLWKFIKKNDYICGLKLHEHEKTNLIDDVADGVDGGGRCPELPSGKRYFVHPNRQ